MKMLLARLKHRILGFRKGTDGIMTVEMVICLPFLFWMITTSFELFEVHRFKAARVKATYTVADLLSREMSPVNDTYMDSAKALFDTQTRDHGDNQVRMSVVTFNSASNSYEVRWSEVRGDGAMPPLDNASVASAHSELPVLTAGQELIIVESHSVYTPIFGYPGLNKSYPMTTKVFTGIRFASQLCWEGSYCG